MEEPIRMVKKLVGKTDLEQSGVSINTTFGLDAND